MVIIRPRLYIFDGLFSGLFGLVSTAETNEANKRMVQETNAQNLAIQQEQWRREDNAYQRKVADLQAAGLNPALALGGGSDSSVSAQMQAPHYETPRLPDNLGLSDGVRLAQGFQSLGIQQQLADAEVLNKTAQTELTGAQADLYRQQLLQSQLDYQVNSAFQRQQTYQNLVNSGMSEREAKARIDQIESTTALNNQAYQGYADTGTWSGIPSVSQSGTVNTPIGSVSTSSTAPIGRDGSAVKGAVDSAVGTGHDAVSKSVQGVQRIYDATQSAIGTGVQDAAAKARQIIEDASETINAGTKSKASRKVRKGTVNASNEEAKRLYNQGNKRG